MLGRGRPGYETSRDRDFVPAYNLDNLVPRVFVPLDSGNQIASLRPGRCLACRTGVIFSRGIQSMTIDINQYQSMSINRLILIIDDQWMVKIRVVIDWYRFPITIDRLIDIDWYRLVADFVMFQNQQADGIGT